MIVDNIDIQGHRGFRGLMPENTIPGFIRAVESGVTTLEMDVCMAADHSIVVSHDPYFHYQISTGPSGKNITKANMKVHNLYQMDYNQILKYDVGLKPNPNFPLQRKIPAIKPKLSMVIDTVEAYTKAHQLAKLQYSIELKRVPLYDNVYHADGETFVKAVLAVLDQYENQDRFILQCFDIETLQIIKKLAPNISLAYLIEKSTDYEQNIKDLGFTPDIYSPNYKLVDKSLVDYCNKNNMKLIPWTVNDINDLERLMNMGVHGIISDYPDKAIEVYEGLQLSKG